MALEKRWPAVAVQSFAADGTVDGKIQLDSIEGFRVKQKVLITATGQPSQTLEVKRVEALYSVYVGPVSGDIDSRSDLSAYTTAAGARISAAEQPKALLDPKDIIRSVYRQEPGTTIGVELDDEYGNPINVNNPLPVVFEGSISIGSLDQGNPNNLTNAWPVIPTDGVRAQVFTNTGEAKVSVTTFSAPALPLPTGAATQATLAALNNKFTTDGSGNINVNVEAGTITADSPSTGPNGATAPAQSTQAGFIDSTGKLQPAKVNGNNAVLVDGSAVTQPISATALPLPTGAATSTNQTNGNQQTQIVQGGHTAVVSAAGALNVDGSGVTQPVSGVGTFSVDGSAHTQPVSGTVTANAGTGTFSVDGSGHTQPISAVSLPLPTGAATASSQTDGSQQTQIVQGGHTTTVTAAGALKVDGSAITQPISGSVTVSGTVAVAGDAISTLNSTSATLAGNATFTGSAESLLNFASIVAFVAADQSGTFNIDYSENGTNWDQTESYTFTVASPGSVTGISYILMAEAQYYRIRFVNGSTAQGVFRLQCILKAGTVIGEVQPVSTIITDNTDAQVIKGVVYGKTTGGGGGYVAVKVNPSGALTTDGSGVTQPTNISQVGGSAVALGQQLAAASLPVVLPAAQITTLTPPTTVTSNQGTAAALSGKWPVQVTDGTNTLPTMDVAGRAGFQKITDGTNTMPTMDAVGRPGFQKITDGTNTMPTMDAVGRAGFQKVTDGTNTAAVKAGSTAPGASDPALVVTVSPNSADPAIGPVAPGTAASKSYLTGMQYNSTTPAPTNTQQLALQSDAYANLATSQPDVIVTGQASQTATVNNILTATAGSAATATNNYRSMSVQVNSTGTGGTYIFEGSNDNSNFFTLIVYNMATTTGTPITAAVTASSANIIYIFPVVTNYVRLRIATTITGGSIQAFTRMSQQPWVPPVLQVAQSTAGNLNVTAAQATASNLNANVTLQAGSAIAGKVGIDQTTPGTTNGVAITQVGSTTVASNLGVPGAGALRTVRASSATATCSSVASSATSVTLLASNANRVGATFYNDSTQVLYLCLQGNTASNSNYTVQLAANAYYELPPAYIYTGAITGIWASANGNCRVTELT